MKWTNWKRDLVVAIMTSAVTAGVGFCISWRLVRNEQIRRANSAGAENPENDHRLNWEQAAYEEKLRRLAILRKKIEEDVAALQAGFTEFPRLVRIAWGRPLERDDMFLFPLPANPDAKNFKA